MFSSCCRDWRGHASHSTDSTKPCARSDSLAPVGLAKVAIGGQKTTGFGDVAARRASSSAASIKNLRPPDSPVGVMRNGFSSSSKKPRRETYPCGAAYRNSASTNISIWPRSGSSGMGSLPVFKSGGPSFKGGKREIFVACKIVHDVHRIKKGEEADFPRLLKLKGRVFQFLLDSGRPRFSLHRSVSVR